MSYRLLLIIIYYYKISNEMLRTISYNYQKCYLRSRDLFIYMVRFPEAIKFPIRQVYQAAGKYSATGVGKYVCITNTHTYVRLHIKSMHASKSVCYISTE